MPAKLAVKAKGTVMPSEVPITASSVDCDDGFQNPDLNIRALSPEGGGAVTVKELGGAWLLSCCEVCDSNSKLLEVSVVTLSEFIDLESVALGCGYISGHKCK